MDARKEAIPPSQSIEDTKKNQTSNAEGGSGTDTKSCYVDTGGAKSKAGQKRPQPDEPQDRSDGTKQVKEMISEKISALPTNSVETSEKDAAKNTTCNTNTSTSPSVIDIAQALNLKPGDRIEVRWDLHFDDIGETAGQGPEDAAIGNNEDTCEHVKSEQDGTLTKSPAEMQIQTETRTQTRWWGGTLLQPDGRMHTLQDPSTNDTVQVPIRVIDYDPYIEGGFPDRSLEDVCFLTDHSLYNMGSEASEENDNGNSRMWWRKEGDHWMPGEDMEEEERKLMMGPVSPDRTSQTNNNASANANNANNTSDDEISVTSTSREDALRVVLDTVLQGALQKAGISEKMNQLPPSQQSFMAEKIAKAKEKLTEKLMEQLNNGNIGGDGNGGGLEQVITKEHIQKCMEDLKGL